MYALVKFGQMRRAAGPAGDPDVAAWVAAVVTNGGAVSTPRRAIVETLVTGLKADAIWTKLDRLWLLAAEDQPSALTDLKALTLATTVNSPTFTTDQGYTGNGTTSYVETGYGPSTGAVNFTLNAASISAWDMTDRAAANATITGAIGPGGVNSDLWPFTAISSPTGLLVRINDAFTMLTGTSSRGFFTNNRSGASACQGYYNGSSLGSTTDAASGLSDATFAILSGQTSSHSLNSPTTDQCSVAAYGGSLSSTDAANLYTRLQTYLTAIGAITDDADVNNWVAKTKGNGGTVSKSRQTLVYNLITGLKSDGVWSKLDRLWLFAAENAGSALTDLVAGALATSTATFTTDRGYAGDGSSTFINTNFNPSTAGGQYSLNSAHLMAYDRTSRAASTTFACGLLNTNQSGIITRDSGDVFEAELNESTFESFSNANSDGLFIMERTASSGAGCQQGYRNGSSLGTGSHSSAGIPNANIFVCCRSNAGSFQFGNTDQIAAFSTGAGLGPTLAAALSSRVNTYMTAIGANTY